MKNIMAKLGIDTQVLIDTLKEIQVGGEIGYDELCSVIGRSKKDLAGPLWAARNRLMRDLSMVFGTIRGQGLKRLSDSEKIGAASANIDGIRRAAKRGITIIQAVDTDNLEKQQVSTLNLTVSHLGILAYASSVKASGKINERVIANNGKIPLAITLDALK